MITLDTNISLLCNIFHISRQKLSDEYSGMTIEEIMKAEAAQGNVAAANFDKEILNDPIKLMEVFKLDDVGNKFAILNNMSERDLEDLLPYLDQASLMMGLNFFTKDKLLVLVEKLPKDQLVNLTFQMFSPEQLMYYMPEEQLNKFLMSPEIDKGMMEKYLPTLKPEILAQMLEATTGMPVGGETRMDGSVSFDKQSLLGQLMSMPEDKFREAMVNMPPVNKQDFILRMTNDNPKLFMLFDSSAYTGVIGQRKNKQDIIKSSNVIEPEQLVKMLEKLPRDLTAIVLTQIDPKVFADILIANFKDILSEIVAG